MNKQQIDIENPLELSCLLQKTVQKRNLLVLETTNSVHTCENIPLWSELSLYPYHLAAWFEVFIHLICASCISLLGLSYLNVLTVREQTLSSLLSSIIFLKNNDA